MCVLVSPWPANMSMIMCLALSSNICHLEIECARVRTSSYTLGFSLSPFLFRCFALFADTAHWFSFQLFAFHTIYLRTRAKRIFFCFVQFGSLFSWRIERRVDSRVINGSANFKWKFLQVNNSDKRAFDHCTIHTTYWTVFGWTAVCRGVQMNWGSVWKMVKWALENWKKNRFVYFVDFSIHNYSVFIHCAKPFVGHLCTKSPYGSYNNRRHPMLFSITLTPVSSVLLSERLQFRNF